MKRIGTGLVGVFVLGASAASPSWSPDTRALTVTYVGEWRGGSAETALESPVDIALDRSGNVHILEQVPSRVMVYTRDGRFVRRYGGPRTCLWGCRPDQINGRFFSPTGIAVDPDGNAYVSDLGPAGNGRVQRFAPDGSFSAAFDGLGLDRFSYPRDVAVGLSGGVYVADSGKSRVLLLAGGSGAFIREWAASEFYPGSLAVDDARGMLYAVVGRGGTDANEIVVLSLDGGFVTRLGRGLRPGNSLTLDRQGRLYLTGSNAVKVFSPEGELLGEWGTWGSGPGQFRDPMGIAVDDQGLVYVAEYVNRRVQIFRVEFDRRR